MGICKLEGGLHRHIDIKIFPRSQYGFGVLYFTGSAAHNITMRNVAIDYGFSLSEAGIVHQTIEDKMKSQKDKKASPKKLDPNIVKMMEELADAKKNCGKIISEKDIFKAFGMDYVEPCNRI